MFKYEKEILAAYKRVGFTPRDNQLEHIDQIVRAFVDDGIKNLVISAPTGTGKSIIGVIVAEVVHEIKHPGQSQHASFLLTATNALTEQYQESLGDGGRDRNFVLVKGANNYECSALSNPQEVVWADSCASSAFRKAGLQDIIDMHCNGCEYRRMRDARINARHLVTNYSYFFVDRMYAAQPLAPRTVTVFDEAHLLNDLFVDHVAIEFSEKRLQTFVDEVGENLKLGNHQLFKDVKLIREGLMKGMITEETYPQFLEVLRDAYISAAQAAAVEANNNIRNQTRYTKVSRLSKRWAGLATKITDLFEFEYPAVFEYKKKDVAKGQNEHEASVKPLFVGEMFEILNNSEFNLLMSATVTQEYAKRTLQMTGETRYIRLAPQFPIENKKVVFFKTQTLNYTTMKDPATIAKLCATVVQISKHHTKESQRGIVLCPSFVVTEQVAKALKTAGIKIFEHRRGEKLADVVEDFKRHPPGLPAVLVTPSGYEGVDLPGDFSRFQIIVKCPFLSLGDKRIKHIADQFPTLYSISALQKIVQGAGRSVRSSDDWAITYFLDTAIQRLWKMDLNEWKNEFTTSYTTELPDAKLG